MSKKDFKGGFNTLLGGGKPTNPKGAKQFVDAMMKQTEDNKKITQRGAKQFVDAVLKKTEDKPKVGRPKSNFKEITKSSQEGTKEKETRATFIVNEDLLEKLKAIAYWDRVMIKDVVDIALQEAVSRYEKKNGSVKPVPKK